MKKLLAIWTLMLMALVAGVSTQINVPYPSFTPNADILSAEVNANNSTLSTQALNRTGGNITGNITVDSGITVDGLDLSAVLANSAGLRGALSDETGTGVAVFGTSPTIATPTLTGLVTASGGQIAFPATQSASANVNTLDDYEEGSWTPVIGGSGGTSGQTYATQLGRYIKIGRLVFVTCQVTLSAKGTITTSVQIQGLPFAAAGVLSQNGGAVYWHNLNTNWVQIVGFLQPNATAADLQGSAAASPSTATALVTGDITNNSVFIWSGLYEAGN